MTKPDLESLTYEGKRRRLLRLECIELLALCRDSQGGLRRDPRCRNPKCRWLNEDGTFGCTDPDAFHFDHKAGGGSEDRKSGKITGNRLYDAIKKHPEDFQLLCANCNEIKSKGEKLGGQLHKKPETRFLAAMRQQFKEEGQTK